MRGRTLLLTSEAALVAAMLERMGWVHWLAAIHAALCIGLVVGAVVIFVLICAAHLHRPAVPAAGRYRQGCRLAVPPGDLWRPRVMRILVLGASGFIGRRVVAALLASGHEVIPAGRHVAVLHRLFPAARWSRPTLPATRRRIGRRGWRAWMRS